MLPNNTLLLKSVGFTAHVSNKLFQILTLAMKLLAVVSLADWIDSNVFDRSQPFTTTTPVVTPHDVALYRFVKETPVLN